MPALASLLGLPLTPAISPLLSARLSKDELRTATAAFHRARGYHQALDFSRFRESVLQEAFVAMPLLLMKRVFLVWSYLQEETGHMSLKEFLVGVTIVTKGTRDEQLRFVFQLMNTSGSQELSKSDTLAFLAAVATSEGKIVAVEDDAERTNSTSNSSKEKLWTVDAFADLLHPRTTTALGSELLTLAKFLKVLASRKFRLLYLLDWIPVFATQFQVTEVSSLQITTPCTSPANRDFKKLQQSPVPAVRKDVKLNTDREIPSIISPLELSAALLNAIRAECFSILDYLVSTGEEFATDTFQQRFSGILPHQIAEAVKQVDRLFPASASLSSSSGASDVSGSLKETGRQRFKHLVLILLSAFAKSAEDVVHLLFSIFDEDSRGGLDVLQFAAFLRFASSLTHAEGERMAFSIIGHLSGSLTSPPASPSEVSSSSSSQYEQDESTAPSVSFATFADFFKSAAYREMELLSYPELEILHLIFYLQLSSLSSALRDKEAANSTLSAAIERNGLKQCTKQLRLVKSDPQRSPSEQNRFCLMERYKWNAIIEIVCDGNTEDVDDAEEIDNTHDSLANDIGVAVFEKTIGSDSTARANGKETGEFVLVPIILWVMLSFWQRTKLKREATVRTTHNKNAWREWTTCVNFSSAPRTSDYQVAFQGFCVAVSLSCLGLEGAEELQSSRSQAIVSEACSIQDLLDVVQLPNDVKRRRTSVRECQLVFNMAHNGSTRQTLRIPEEFRRIPLKVLMSTILPQDAQPESFRCFELQATAVEVSGCDNGEVEQQHTCDLPTRESSNSSPNPLHRSARLNASTGLSSVHGLANLGNTCFMNSALQCLVVTPLLREYFLHQEYLYDMGTRYTASGNESPKSSNSHVFGASSNSNSPKRGKKKSDTILPSSCFLPLAFGQLVAEMNAFSSTGAISGVCDVISPEKMRNAIAMLFPHLSDGSQQDAQEFLSSLLSSLGEELRRQSVLKLASFSEENCPSNSSGASILSPQSRAFLSRLPSFSRSYQESSEVETTESAPQKQLQFQISDSDGRPDSTVANEWWISHLVSEPSIFTALFCGQFKSVLTCNVCGMKSTRFEPFSSLQLPIVDENGSSVMTSGHSRKMVDMIVIVHFAQPSAHSGSRSLRLTVQVGEDWTLDQLLMKLQQDHEAYSLDSKRHYLACVVDGCRIQAFVDRDTLLVTIPSALDVFELENIEDDADANESSQTLLDRAFHSGDELLVWTSDDRFVKGVVTSVRHSSPRSVATRDRLQSAHSLLSPSPANYDAVLSEGLSAGKTMRAVSRVRPLSTPTSSSHVLFFRFVHRRQVLVPFYCKSPQRLALCGVPSVHRAHASSITGKLLYRVAQERFLPQFATRTFRNNSASSHLTNTLVIRRVRGDGKCCSRCHWTAQCVGCVVPRSSDMIEDLEMDGTFSIDWNLEPFAGADNDGDNDRAGRDEIEWLLTQGMLSIDDHASYVSYRQTSSYSLGRSLKILCNSETLEAKCSACQTRHQHQTESCRDDEEKRASSSQQGPSTSLHTKELSLWSAPPILIIQLKRFELGAGSYSWEKVNHCVDFPIDNLDLAAFLGVEDEYPNRPSLAQEPNSESVKRAAAFLHTELNFPLDTASRDCTGYSLYGIVNHMGDIGSGHYTAHIKHPENDDWWLADDAIGLPVNIQKLTPSSAAYLLFYVRHDLLPPSSIAAAAGGKHANGSSAAAAAFHERKRLSTFFPRQKHALKLSDAAIQGAWQNETWLGAKERSGSNLQSPWSDGGDKSDKCNFM